jgi:hypothetical protein
MAATVSGSKTVTKTPYPTLVTAATLTTIMATAVENLTVLQLQQIEYAIERIGGGHEPSATIGSILQ